MSTTPTPVDALVDFVVGLAITLGFMSSPSITVNPDPPQRGRPLEICYTFNDAEEASVDIEVTFTLPGNVKDVTTYTLTSSKRCITVNVPATALLWLVTDQSGAAEPEGGGLQDPPSSETSGDSARLRAPSGCPQALR